MTASRCVIALAGAAFLVGACSDESGRRPGIDQTTVRGHEGERLTLVKPGAVMLERGDAETVKIRLRRDDVPGDVGVSIDNLPGGVEAVDAPRSTRDDSVNIVLKASDRADLVRNHQAYVTAEAPDGMRATESIEINVRE